MRSAVLAVAVEVPAVRTGAGRVARRTSATRVASEGPRARRRVLQPAAAPARFSESEAREAPEACLRRPDGPAGPQPGTVPVAVAERPDASRSRMAGVEAPVRPAS